MTTIIMLQKKVVQALEQGKDPAPALKALADYRANQEVQKELGELQQIADNRKALRDRADAIKVKVEIQDKAIDEFLKARDTLIAQLQPLLEPMGELTKLGASGWEREPGVCYAGYNDYTQFAGEVRGVPKGYLDENFGCPFLEMAGGQDDARGKATEAYGYFASALGILSAFVKGQNKLALQTAEGLMAMDSETETTEVESSCRVCQHPKVTEINTALKEGKSLRALEEEYNVPRSTLSRHKNKCLNLGVVRMRD